MLISILVGFIIGELIFFVVETRRENPALLGYHASLILIAWLALLFVYAGS